MKRREFFKSAGVGAAAVVAAPVMAHVAEEEGVFVHDPRDYAHVPEEVEEFQEYEVDVPEDSAEEEIIWE